MFVAGNDPVAKTIAMVPAREIGFVPEDAGPITNAKGLEEMARVWMTCTQSHGRGVGWAVSTE